MSEDVNFEVLSGHVSNIDRFQKAIGKIDSLNDEDPNRITHDNKEQGYELYFSKQLFNWVRSLDPQPSEELLLAARSQHIRRWKIPRDSYPIDRAGYLKWRSDLKRFHARTTREILTELGYDQTLLDRVESLNLKRGLKTDKDCQTLEDGLCLVFLEKQFASFSQKTDREKMVGILRKTWAKMSEKGRQAALGLDLGEEELSLVKEALEG